jgi:phosphoglycolate phosphatase-like HAD superfamily hydrolase
MLRAIVFDFDGVLAESVDVKTRAYALLFENEGEEVVQKVVDYHIKNGGVSRFEKIRFYYSDILYRSLSEERFQELCAQFSHLVVDEVVTSPWVDGAKEFLIRNKKKYTFIIISGTPEVELKKIVKRREMAHFFNSVRGSPKDKVTLLGEVMDEYHLTPQEIVFIGDAETDWCAARETGVNFIFRCSPEGVSLPGYIGPRLFSLNELEKNL